MPFATKGSRKRLGTGSMMVVDSDPELHSLRHEIDDIDRQLLTLLAHRMRLVLRVGDYKRDHEIPVYDPERERAILDRLSRDAPSPLTAESVKRVFERLIDESRYLEQHHMSAGAPKGSAR